MTSKTPRTDAMAERYPSWPATACQFARQLEIEAAAAPELLEACQLAVKFFEENGGDNSYSWLPQIRAAIAKAGGAQ